MSDEDPVAFLADKIAVPGTVVTWLNHWSIQKANWQALAGVDHIGIDGTFLQLVLQACGLKLGRTSADLVLPVLLNSVLEPGKKVAFIGAQPEVAKVAASRITQHEVIAFNGYEELEVIRSHPRQLLSFAPDVIILGLGVGLQDEVAVEMHKLLPNAIVCTAGGWIDQFARDQQYFPRWIHKFRLGWAWRIAHEPRRLIRRYTLEAFGFLLDHRSYVNRLKALGPVDYETSIKVCH